MRIAFLLFGLTAYQDAAYRALADLGDELLLVYPVEMEGLPFDRSRFGDYAQRHEWHSDAKIWEGKPPPPSVTVPLVRAFRPHVVYMASWHGKGYRAVMRDQRGRALRVLYQENVWYSSPKQWVGRLSHRVYLDPLFDCAFVPSDRAEFFARRLGFTPDRVIRGALSADVARFDRGPRAAEELASRRQFLYSARFVPHKSPDVMAAAYKRYREMVPAPWRLVVAGEGPMADVFNGIDGVTRLGFVQPDDLVDEMHRSSCLVMPSQIEHFGVVLHEAATAGLPLLASEGVGAAPLFVQDGFNGWLVPPGDAPFLADAMARVSALPAHQLAAMSEGSRSLARRMSPTVYARNFHDQAARLYERVVHRVSVGPEGIEPSTNGL